MLALVILVALLGGTTADRADVVEDIYIRFYNGTTVEEYVDVRLFNATDLLEVQGFNISNPTLFFITGYRQMPVNETVKELITAYLETRPEVNALLLDWSNMAYGDYLTNAAPNTKKVGVAAAEQMWPLIDAGLKQHVVGFSLGGQVAGYYGRTLQQQYGYKLKRITALDPAGPDFYPNGILLVHVSANDAEFVDVIHTSAGLLGAPVSTGTADYWPNGGTAPQPGCSALAPIPVVNSTICSHRRALQLYTESLRTEFAFPASPATSYVQFLANPTPEQGFVYMGIGANISARGSYYLHTNGEPPFGRGIAGLHN